MTISVSSPVTGSAQTGLTSPTYTVVADQYPGGNNGKQYAVTTLGGTQTGVRTHAVSDPFTIAFVRASALKALQSPNPVTGRYGNIAKNVHSVVLRKGVNPAANQAPEIMLGRCYFEVPAGSDSYDAANIRAGISLLIGAMSQQSAGWGDTVVTGLIG
jgi:hypothetical protein